MSPLVYEINTRPWLWSLSERAGKDLTLATVPEEQFRFWRDLGFTHIWLMGVWRTGPRGRAHSLTLPEFASSGSAISERAFAEEEVAGSPYAVAEYEVSETLGGNEAMRSFRKRLAGYGLKLILDFVPNHLGHDHPWLSERPELFVQSPLKRPGTFREETRHGQRWFAYGKDPFMPAWVDTVQLDYRNPATRPAMIQELERVARLCDGVRCDMAMLLLEDVFASTWKEFPARFERPETEFWEDAIGAVRKDRPEFLFLAEVYWNMETRLQELGFDFTYDKRLYDHLLGKNAVAVQNHLLSATRQFLERGTHFLENHDELRIASLLSFEEHRAAALLIAGLPGMCLLHEGQLTGARQRLSVHLGRRRLEAEQAEIANFYGTLLKIRRETGIGRGDWHLLQPQAAWPANPTAVNFMVIQWEKSADRFYLGVVNLAAHRSQCVVGLASDPGERSWRMKDLLGTEEYVRDGATLKREGLFLDLPAHGAQLFEFGVD